MVPSDTFTVEDIIKESKDQEVDGDKEIAKGSLVDEGEC
jgi:hypothetical protein